MVPKNRTAFEYIVGPLAMSTNQSFRQKSSDTACLGALRQPTGRERGRIL
jgi:hypothetical protein